jgi:ATP-dependent Clp protease adapter protein ClpS
MEARGAGDRTLPHFMLSVPLRARSSTMSLYPADRPEVPRRPDNGPGPSKTHGPPGRPLLPRYKVVLLSNPTQDLMHVVRSVMLLTRFPREEATHKMWEAHHAGRSVVLITYLERAELYAEQFGEYGLTVIVEPA